MDNNKSSHSVFKILGIFVLSQLAMLFFLNAVSVDVGWASTVRECVTDVINSSYGKGKLCE